MKASSWRRNGRPPELVATLGPASLNHARALAEAGATAFRLNASHMAATELCAAVEQVRSELPEHAIVIDLQGAKMRLGEFAPRTLVRGQSVSFGLATHGADEGVIPVPHPELLRAMRPGDVVRCDDDRVRFAVTEVREREWSARCLVDGTLEPRKAINLVDHPVELDDLGAADAAHMDALAGLAGLAFAISFMTDGHEATWVRRRVPDGSVIGKVERRQAVEQIAAIGAVVDAVWICRGDLGAQLGTAALARWVAGWRPDELPVPTLMAGQVLEHLTTRPWATRTEACHLFDLLERGYAGIVLSDETAIGVDPIGAVRTAASLQHSFSGE